MQLYHIPELFEPEHPLAVANIYFYKTHQSSQKNKVVLSQHLLCFLVKGEKEIMGAQQTQGFNNQQICLLPAGNALMTENLSVEQQYESILLFFSNDFLTKLLENQPLESLASTGKKLAPILFTKDTYLTHFQESLLLLGEALKESPSMRMAKLTELFLYLLKKYPLPMKAFIGQAIGTQNDFSFTKTINRYLFDNLSYEELAFLCNMSVSTFKRKFSQVYQTTPKKYFVAQRMSRAVQLLKESHRPSEIYFELGYENLSSFSTAFKKHFGSAPSAYMGS